MKRCPTCQRTYADDSLSFCLQDGAALSSVASEPSTFDPDATLTLREGEQIPPTELFDPSTAPTLYPPAQTTPQRSRHTARDADAAPRDAQSAARGVQTATPAAGTIAPAPQQKSSNPLLVAGITAIVVLLLVLVGIGIALLFRSSSESKDAGSNATKASNTSADNSPTVKNNANNRNENSNSNNSRAPLKITATASSTRAPIRDITYVPANVLDGSLLTSWTEGVDGPGSGEWIRCDFEREVKLNYIHITPGYFKTPALWKQNNRLASATIYFSDGSSRSYNFPDKMQEQKLDAGGVRTRFVRLVIGDTYGGTADDNDTPISELSFEWEP